MTTSIKQTFKHMPTQEEVQMKAAFTTLLDEFTELRASITGITAQLDLDGGVTGTTFAANNDPATSTLTA